MFFAERRDALLDYLVAHGVEAKVHYPVPIYQQDALRFLGHKAGDFPVTDRHAREVITLPVDQHLSRSEENTSELQSLMRISYAVFCLKKKNKISNIITTLK